MIYCQFKSLSTKNVVCWIKWKQSLSLINTIPVIRLEISKLPPYTSHSLTSSQTIFILIPFTLNYIIPSPKLVVRGTPKTLQLHQINALCEQWRTPFADEFRCNNNKTILFSRWFLFLFSSRWRGFIHYYVLHTFFSCSSCFNSHQTQVKYCGVLVTLLK